MEPITQIEQELLGSLVVHPDQLGHVNRSITGPDFSNKNGKIALETIQQLEKENGNINETIFLKKFTEKGGDKSYGVACLDTIPLSSTVNNNAQIIAEESYKRRLGKIGYQLYQLYKDNKPIDQFQQETENFTEILKTNTPQYKRLVAVSISDFLIQEHPHRTNLLSPWLPSQGLCMIFSWRGVGKTHVSLGVACALAAGGEFLKWSASEPVGVLFIDGEMPAAVLQERLQSIIAGIDKQPTAPLKIITPDNQPNGMPDLATAEGQRQVEEHITDDIKVVIIDNLSTLVRTGRENDAEGWAPVQGWFLKLRAAGKSVIAIHHSNKSGASRGTSKREDVLDTVIRLERPHDYTPDQGACFEVHFEKNRGIYGEDVKPFEAQLITGSHGESIWTTRSVEDSNYSKIVKLHNDGLSKTEIADEIGVHKSTVGRNIKKAIAEGDIKNV